MPLSRPTPTWAKGATAGSVILALSAIIPAAVGVAGIRHALRQIVNVKGD